MTAAEIARALQAEDFDLDLIGLIHTNSIR